MKKPQLNDSPITPYLSVLLNFKLLVLLTFFMIPDSKGQDTRQAISLFDGKTLEGWQTINPDHQKFWSVKDSIIIGGDGKTKIPENTFLYTEQEFEDFEFRCLFRLTGDPQTGMINSGIQYRSKVRDGKMIGYQADIGNGFWGDIYDEHRRGELMDGNLSTLRHLLKEDGWNSYIIRVQGNRHELYINGVKTGDYIESNPKIPSRGVIGFQLHSGGAAKVEFRAPTITVIN